MELGAHVWLRREDSHWGWVPAVVTKKESVVVSGVELINVTLEDDRNIEVTMPPPTTAAKQSHRKSEMSYYGEGEKFETTIRVDPEQLKTADHDDIKLRNLPNSFHLSGEDREAGVLTSPGNHIDPEIVGGVNDLIGLTHLHEPAILHALRLRYDADIIYTATGPILIAVNPFKKMDIYSKETMEQYREQGENMASGPSSTHMTPFKNRRNAGQGTAGAHRLPPHVYQTADDAYRAMMRGMENTELVTKGTSAPTNQSILVSGESGAGKTVTTKIVLNYFAMLSRRRSEMTRSTPSKHGASPRAMDDGSIEQQVLQSNPILEAFGNARTIRNDNSSRFGKYMNIRFSRSGKLTGANIETYLLEKVRLIHPGPGERNYHVFYQFLAACTHTQRRELGLGNSQPRDFRLLSQTGTYDRRDQVSDADNHKEMLVAMDTIGFEPQTIQSLLRLVSGVLFAGNICFTESKDGDSCHLTDDKNSRTCADLLGLDFDGLASALTCRYILAGDEVVHKPLPVEDATKALEALIKAVYGATFDYIVHRVNQSIVEDKSSAGQASIGVLDIFGFETFETNSFEQLCINYTNEALQQQFNKYVFKLEQQEYEKEGIMWKFISFPDNQDVLDLIDKKHTGILALLDEQCILPRSTDEKYTRYLYARCDSHTRFCATSSQRVDHLFSIEHYAGYVEYSTDSWLEKNKDQLPSASSDLLKASSFAFIAEIQPFVRSEDRAGRGTVATKSVSSQFSAQLRVLRARIDETVPHYVRCLKPNDELVPHYFEPKNVVAQLRCGGVLEAVRVSRAGYPTRYPHEVFLARYYILGNQNDHSPQSPVFSPRSQSPHETDLKRLISKIAFDLWYSEFLVLKALISNEKSDRKLAGAPRFEQRFGSTYAMQKKSKIQTGPYAPPFNLVVESSVMTPDDQRRKRKNDPNVARLERLRSHNVARPESVEEFNSLDFASRCAVAGLQLGRSKVFLRREAFDRIEAMRSEKFFFAASQLQKLVRGKMCRDHFLCMKGAAIKIQSMLRMKLSAKAIVCMRIDDAAVAIQSAWRGFWSRIAVAEIMIARRYAASLIQQAYRNHRVQKMLTSSVFSSIVAFQSLYRGFIVRKRMESASKSLFKRRSQPVTRPPSLQSVPLSTAPSQTTLSSHTLLGNLFRDIQNENWAAVESLLDQYPELAESVDRRTGELALHKIARHSDAWSLLVDMILVLYPKALIHRDNMGALPIHHASAHDNLTALEIIYSAYKDGVKETDKMGRLPLHVAATYDAVDCVKFLLSKFPEGAYTMIQRPSGETGGGLPIHLACANNASIGTVTALLAENFASAKRSDENGDLPIHLLLRGGDVVDPVVVKNLLTCFNGSLSRTDMNGDLPLSVALKSSCRPAVVNSLLTQYPDAASVLDGDGHSPLFLAFKHSADDRTIMGLLNHAPELATAVDRKTGLLPIQVATENEHSHFIVHNLLKRDMPIDLEEKVRAQLTPHRYSWNHIVSNTEDLYHQVVSKVLQSCTQPQVLALAHIEGPDGKIALAAATPVCKHEMRVMLRLFNTLEVVNQRPAYTNPVSDTQIFYALRYDPPPKLNGQYTVLHEEKKEDADNDYLEEFDDHSHISGVSRLSVRSNFTARSQQTIEDKLRLIRKEKGQQVIAKLTSRSEIVERELRIRKDYHLSRHYVPAIISVHHTVQHAAYSEAMAEPGYCITMEGADTTAENLMLDLRKAGKMFPGKALKRIGISLLHMHEHGIIHGDFGTHNIGKFGSRWKLLGVGGSVPIGGATDPKRGFYHPPESIFVDGKRSGAGKKTAVVKSITAETSYDIWAYGVVLFEAISGAPLAPYACRGKRAMTDAEVSKIGNWDESSLRKALKTVPDQDSARDLLRQLLHPDPQQRVGSMRSVLEHTFFKGGDIQRDGDPQADERHQPGSHASNQGPQNSRSTSNGQSRLGNDSRTSGSRQHGMDPPEVKSSHAMQNIENRENRSRTSGGSNKFASDAESTSHQSIGSNRSFRLRNLRTALRR